MKRCLVALLTLSTLACGASESEAKNPVVVIKTSMGTIKVELFEKDAPITVKNFLKYVEDKHYDNTIFHRVMGKENTEDEKDFMIQGGGFSKDRKEKKTRDKIKNEAGNGQSNKRGTLAMARTNDPDSATAQFFINVKDNDFLDKNARSAGYAVFGKVIEGMNVVDKIKAVKTGTKKFTVPHPRKPGETLEADFENVPVDDVVIESVRRADKE
jgi:cyclophilin family peptidyl-prolyl cis-trans isomerase